MPEEDKMETINLQEAFTIGELMRLAEAYQWASDKMLNNQSNGVWSHWDHFISGLNWHLDNELYEEVSEWYDFFKSQEEA